MLTHCIVRVRCWVWGSTNVFLKAVVYWTVCFALISDITSSTQVACNFVNCASRVPCAVCYNGANPTSIWVPHNALHYIKRFWLTENFLELFSWSKDRSYRYLILAYVISDTISVFLRGVRKAQDCTIVIFSRLSLVLRLSSTTMGGGRRIRATPINNSSPQPYIQNMYKICTVTCTYTTYTLLYDEDHCY